MERKDQVKKEMKGESEIRNSESEIRNSKSEIRNIERLE